MLTRNNGHEAGMGAMPRARSHCAYNLLSMGPIRTSVYMPRTPLGVLMSPGESPGPSDFEFPAAPFSLGLGPRRSCKRARVHMHACMYVRTYVRAVGGPPGASYPPQTGFERGCLPVPRSVAARQANNQATNW